VGLAVLFGDRVIEFQGTDTFTVLTFVNWGLCESITSADHDEEHGVLYILNILLGGILRQSVSTG